MARICRTIGIYACLVTASILTGCGGKQESNQTVQKSASPTATQTTATTAQSAAAVETSANAASSGTVIEEGANTEPAQCVAVFLDSLRRGDEAAVNSMLTPKAREELAKTSYVIEPLGAPEGKFEIGRVAFPYEEKNVALVECVWTDPPSETTPPLSMDVVCEVQLTPEGWRLAAMGLAIPGTEDTLVLDFEDAAALQATIDAAFGMPQDAAAGAEQQVVGTAAEANNTARLTTPAAGTGTVPELPATPPNSLRSMPSPSGSSSDSADRIALPPLPQGSGVR
ncbi:MAG: hypothetical protein KatS3mg111_1382 [Pirellulaceae bacterium]|nr:MAG: hypothetical protein KatS3mg111_1382 [Pirellulaceae bacterium]